MSLSRRLRNIAKTQLNNLKDRLDKADEEADFNDAARQAEVDAANELNDPADMRLARRSPEEIATGAKTKPPSPPAARPPTAPAPSQSPGSPLTIHYRRLGVEDGADLGAVEEAYAKLRDSCQRIKERVPKDSEELKSAEEILKRVDDSYNTLRDALDPTAGRFDKLEL